jgi:signal transduction histidine kinase
MSAAAALKQIPVFKHLDDSQVQSLAMRAGRLALDSRTIVFREGDASDSLYVILAGSVRVYREADKGQVIELDVLGAGSFFGELALLDSGPRSATIVTLTHCDVLVVDKHLFAALIHESPPEVVLGMLADLSQKMRASNERRIQEQVAQQALRTEMELERHRALSRMVAGVAHEINTPLGIANTAACIISQELTSPLIKTLTRESEGSRLVNDVLEAIDLLQRNIQRAHKLIQDFKRVSVGQLTDVKEQMDLSEAVAEVIGLFDISARRAGLEIVICDVLPATSRTWVGYRGHLSQVLLNLLTNVERYAYPPHRGGKVEVTLAATDTPAPTFTVTVRDFGKGIRPEDVPHVFDVFFTTGRSAGGSGLGLAIVHSIVTGPLQGTVTVNSELDAGTTFSVTFPQTIDDQEGGSVLQSTQLRSPSESAQPA